MNAEIMISKAPNDELVARLLEAQEGPCVSILLPLLQPARMQKQNINLLTKSVKRVKSALSAYRTTEKVRLNIEKQLDELTGTIESTGSARSIGIFVSTAVSGVVEFPFEVNEITLVAGSFETRDLWYLKEYRRPYYTVMLGKNGARLFMGIADSLEEIRNDSFPASFEDDYEYQRSSIGSSHGYGMKGFEKDKGAMQDTRLKDQIRSTARDVASHLKTASDELVVAGPVKLAKDFVNAFPAPEKVLGSVGRAISQKDFLSDAPAIWQTVQNSRSMKVAKLIGELDNLGLNYKAGGIRDVWKAATEGRGRVLLVEKDLRARAYLPDGAQEIRLRPPRGRYLLIADAVDDVIEKVKGKGGDVVFVEPRQLRKFEGIALMFRY